MSQQQFDWYRVSLINEQKPDLQQFQKIIRSSNISQTLDRVPTSYRKKLLTLFQITSGKMKQQIKTIKSVNQSLIYKKSALFDRIQHMQKGLQQSKSQLVRMKSAVIQKKKMTNKLKQKIDTLKKNKSQQTYFCPFCSRNDFSSRQVFTFHMFTEHQTYKTQQNDKNKLSIPNNSFSSSVNNELKDFILTLKDKEMQLMKMILSQKKQMETQDLQRIYQREMNFMTMKNNSQPQYLSEKKYALSQGLGQEFYGNKDLNLEKDQGQIRGESQFLFYQKSQKYQKAAQKEEYSLRKALEDRKKELNRHPYYDIFKDLQENKSLNVDVNSLQEQQSDRKMVLFVRNEQKTQENTTKKQTGFKFISNFNLKSNEEIQQSERKPPVQPLKMTSNNLQPQQFHPSITDRLKEEQRKAAANNSIYSDLGRQKSVTKGFSSQQGYVFNSGPLVDDNGGYSDWQDYFGEENVKKESKLKQQEQSRVKGVSVVNKQESNNDLTINFNISKDTNFNLPPNHPLNLPTQNSRQQESIIQDEQIKLNPGSYSFVSRSSYSKQHISQLLSPSSQSIPHNTSQFENESQHQNKYSMYHNSFNQKSQIYDLSDSFSKRDLQLSKDQSSINLSDLKLSKLQKKRASQKLNQKNNPVITEKINSPTYGKKSQFSNQQDESTQNFTKKPLDFILVSEEKTFNFESSNQPKINLLNQFQRKVVQPQPPIPLIPSNYSFQKKQTYQFNEFYRQSPHQMIPKKSIGSTNPNKNGMLNNNQFCRKQSFSPPKANTYEQINKEERALSPQQFFSQQMKKTSYGTFNPKPSQNSNQNSCVSESLQSQKSNLPPKNDLKEYQKSSFGQSRKQSSLNRSQQSLQKQSNQRGSSSRERKKFRRHQDLQNEKQGLLNQFFKKQFNQSDNQNQKFLSEMQKLSEENGNFRNSQSRQSLEKSRKSVQKKSYVSQSQSQSYSRQYNQSYNSGGRSYEEDSSNGILDEFIK